MASIEIFKNESFGEVRVAGTSEQPLFCLTDICKVLDLDSSQVMKRLEDGVVTIHPITDSLGRERQANFVNEDGLYDVILDSRKPQAKAFRKWITSEVLPSIRKTGSYSVQQRYEIPQSFSEALMLAAKHAQQIEEQQKQIEAKDEKIKQDAPRVLFSKAVETAKRSCLVAELAKILQQNGVNIGQNRLFKWLRKHNYLCSRGQYYNQHTQKAMELGLFEIKQTTINKPDGTVLVSTTTKVTGKGQVYFVEKFLGETNIGRAAI